MDRVRVVANAWMVHPRDRFARLALMTAHGISPRDALRYAEDQPRDEDGKFAATDSGGAKAESHPHDTLRKALDSDDEDERDAAIEAAYKAIQAKRKAAKPKAAEKAPAADLAPHREKVKALRDDARKLSDAAAADPSKMQDAWDGIGKAYDAEIEKAPTPGQKLALTMEKFAEQFGLSSMNDSKPWNKTGRTGIAMESRAAKEIRAADLPEADLKEAAAAYLGAAPKVRGRDALEKELAREVMIRGSMR